MRWLRLIALLLGLSFGLSAGNLSAKPVPPLSGPVVDEAGVLASGERSRIEQALQLFKQQTGKQLQLLIIDSLEGDNLEEFSIRVAEQWKIGTRGRDDGVILLIAVKDRALRIEVGGGVEGDLTDAEAGRIVQNIIVPYFREQKMVSGIVAGLQAIANQLGGSLSGEAVAPLQMRGHKSRSTGFHAVMFIFFFLVIGVLQLLQGLMGGRRGYYGGGHYGGGGGWSGGGGGGWSGGGGGFSGGGASGKW